MASVCGCIARLEACKGEHQCDRRLAYVDGRTDQESTSGQLKDAKAQLYDAQEQLRRAEQHWAMVSPAGECGTATAAEAAASSAAALAVAVSEGVQEQKERANNKEASYQTEGGEETERERERRDQREKEVDSLMSALGECEDELADLRRTHASCDGLIASLRQDVVNLRTDMDRKDAALAELCRVVPTLENGGAVEVAVGTDMESPRRTWPDGDIKSREMVQGNREPGESEAGSALERDSPWHANWHTSLDGAARRRSLLPQVSMCALKTLNARQDWMMQMQIGMRGTRRLAIVCVLKSCLCTAGCRIASPRLGRMTHGPVLPQALPQVWARGCAHPPTWATLRQLLFQCCHSCTLDSITHSLRASTR